MRSSVLIVEDDPLIRKNAATMLEEAGLNIVEFVDAAKAANYVIAHTTEVAAIFASVNLSGAMDGVELARIVARIAPHTKLIVTSGHAVETLGRLPPTVRFLKKPWLPLDVLTAIQSAVEEHRVASAP